MTGVLEGDVYDENPEWGTIISKVLKKNFRVAEVRKVEKMLSHMMCKL